ncbi:MAG: histidine phosphatase family protein [Dehalococcoidia bacterium]
MQIRQKKPPTRIWIARHGQTEANRTGLFCGHAETPLTDLGRAQARALGRRLAAIEFAAVYTSDFSRAVLTAALALDGRALTPHLDPDLRELHYGEWEMHRESEIRRTHPEQVRLMRAEDPAWQPPGGETTAMVRARTFRALQRIARRHQHHDVLVVSHGTAINCMLAEVLGAAPTHVFRFDVANCGLSRVTAGRSRLAVSLLNETGHLEGLTASGAAAK